MPGFQKRYVPYLIEYSKDTSLICPCDHFPVNPVSSIPPYRINNGEECIMLGEYLLWCAESVIEICWKYLSGVFIPIQKK
jgi:hypothetical protein